MSQEVQASTCEAEDQFAGDLVLETQECDVVVYDAQTSRQRINPSLATFVSGAGAGLVNSIICAPLDLVSLALTFSVLNVYARVQKGCTCIYATTCTV
jgi:hypothetical protein